MRLAVPAALILLAGAAIGRRGSTGTPDGLPAPPPGDSRSAPDVDVKEVQPVTDETPPETRLPELSPAPWPPPGARATVPPPKPAPESRPALLARLVDELRLDEAQATYVSRILREREEEIRDCHERYRRSGILDVRDYEWWVKDRKAVWFRRVDAVLDRFQHEQFVHLAGRNVLGEGLEFEVADGMAVLE